MRIVTCSEWNDRVLYLFKKINVLTISMLFQNETAKFVHRRRSINLLVNLSNYLILSKNSHLTRSTTNKNLQTPLFRLQRIQKSIKFTDVKIWNSIPKSKIPSNLRKSSFRNFKKCSKHIYFFHLISIDLSSYTPSTKRIIYSTAFIYCIVGDAICVVIPVALARGGDVPLHPAG